MKTSVLLKRFGYYLIGFSIGLIILTVFLKKKDAEFCYGIDCRILKNIRSKNLVYTPQSETTLKTHSLDTVAVNYVLNEGDVDMSRSNTKLDSCKIYVIEGKLETYLMTLTIQNCEKTATIQSIEMQ